MKDLIVGSTGFVGRNIIKEHTFSMSVHSVDVEKAYGMKPDFCIYAGVPSAMFQANESPKADEEVVSRARENLRRISPKRVVLISTVAVYSDCDRKDEGFESDASVLSAYGKNRLWLERGVREDHRDVWIIRLPALYGKYQKKNFLYDLHHMVPKMLTQEKYDEVSKASEIAKQSYILSENGYYTLQKNADYSVLKAFFKEFHFNALSFTDSRSRYQFYNLARLWDDISKVTDTRYPIVNLVTEPVSAMEVYRAVTGKNDWKNMLGNQPFDYDIVTRYDRLLGGADGYICSAERELDDICVYMREWESNES